MFSSQTWPTDVLSQSLWERIPRRIKESEMEVAEAAMEAAMEAVVEVQVTTFICFLVVLLPPSLLFFSNLEDSFFIHNIK